MDTDDTLHHRYRGDDEDRYRAALYALWIAAREGVHLAESAADPARVVLGRHPDGRAALVSFLGDVVDVHVHLP
jgi:hypothetical protein